MVLLLIQLPVRFRIGSKMKLLLRAHAHRNGPQEFHKLHRGFTLVELLAVVVITAMMSVVAVSIFLNTQIRGNKARSVSAVTQQGSFLVDQVNFIIRSAKSLQPNSEGVTCSPAMSSLTLETHDMTRITLSLSDSALASDGAALSSPEVRVENLNFACSQTAGQPGALIQYSFSLSVGGVTESADNTFTQDFSSQVSLRSY